MTEHLDLQYDGHITREEELGALYGEPLARSLAKEVTRLIAPYRAFIEKAPFAILATVGPEGLDCSPRGDPPGFVRILNDNTLAMPDRRGNNRIDSLRNIVRDPRVALLFLIPGVGETLRVNGLARIVTDEALRKSFSMEGKVPASVVVITVERVYYQCQKALARAKLWDEASKIPRAELPTAGEINKAVDPGFDAETYDREYPEHMKRTIY